MATRTLTRRDLTGIAFLVGGALTALAALLGLAGEGAAGAASAVVFFADLAIAAAFVLLVIGPVANAVARIAFIVGAVGWALLGLGALAGLPGQVGTVAALAAAGGGLVGAILVQRARELGAQPALALLVATIAYAVEVFFGILGVDLQGIGLALTLVFAAALIVTGVLLFRGRGIAAAGRA